MGIDTSRDYAEALDRADKLAHYREQFHVPRHGGNHESIYLCGNSLGLQPKRAQQYVVTELEDWAALGVEGHFHARHAWLPYHELLSADLALLCGAELDEVVAMNTLTVNLHLMLTSFYRPAGKRRKILIGHTPFPSDCYAVKSQIQLRGLSVDEALVQLAPRPGESIVRVEDIEAEVRRQGEELALVLLEGVNYYSGQVIPFERVVRSAHDVGAHCGFDLAHAIGNVPLNLHAWEVDFAVWCSYKYLNGGPGCVGGCFIHQRHGRNRELPRMAGWWGHDKHSRFNMGPEFHPIPGVEGWQLSNPPILPLAALRASLEIFRDAGMSRLRTKSEQLTAYLESLLAAMCGDTVSILTPSHPAERGCQLSVRVKGGRRAHEALLAKGVMCDWRDPDVIRLAPAPLYNRFVDVYDCVEILRSI